MFADATEGTEFDTLEYAIKVKCTNNKSQPKDSYRAEDMYDNHSGKFQHWRRAENISSISGDLYG